MAGVTEAPAMFDDDGDFFDDEVEADELVTFLRGLC
jgi:hypothetical protein